MADKMMYEDQAAVTMLNKVEGFEPKKFLAKNQNNPEVRDLPLKVKKLWFRLVHKDGRLIVTVLRFTDQVAVVEAKVFFGKDDAEAMASYIAQTTKGMHGELYIQTAQHIAASEALNDAGFGCQFSDLHHDAEPEIPNIVKQVVGDSATEEVGTGEVVTAIVKKQEASSEITGEQTGADVEVEQIESKETTETNFADGNVSVVEAEIVQESRFVGMTVDEILATMTFDEAMAVVVDVGYCENWTLGEVAEKRPASLKWYVSNYPGENSELRAGARILLDSGSLQKAG